ncbi:hypothetical protein [Herbaspirillum frisingense]|uniref:Uncharacterized protein n=1 Tax=Herbaspirillum frisingense TaxID=92645 RepID=A0ABU1PI65_9BURK|nr:hypothetical protein [Herbaspirillum frisingense]MDR6585544.1 hypothetical protein [Herbaspirillum frisingense]
MSTTKTIALGFTVGSPAARRVRAPVKEQFLADREEQLRRADALLEEWHAWSATYRPALGIPGCSPSSRQAQSSKQWQSTSEIAEESARKAEMESVEWCVDVLKLPQRQAIGLEMKNRAAGAKVWRPAAGSVVLYHDALDEIISVMRRRGLLSD